MTHEPEALVRRRLTPRRHPHVDVSLVRIGLTTSTQKRKSRFTFTTNPRFRS